jgi:hypothetical protein
MHVAPLVDTRNQVRFLGAISRQATESAKDEVRLTQDEVALDVRLHGIIGVIGHGIQGFGYGKGKLPLNKAI